MNTPLLHTLGTVWALMHRECKVYQNRIQKYGINYVIIYPILYVICFGYLASQVLFRNNYGSMFLYIGNLSLLLLSATFSFAVPLLLDIEGDRFIDYQCTLLPSHIIIAIRIVFSALFTFVLACPFFPIAKLLLPSQFIAPQLSWLNVLIMIFLGSLCLSSYSTFAITMIKHRKQTVNFWIRVNFPLLVLGGFWIPYILMKDNFPFLSLVALANPFLYITEGLRNATIGGSQYFSVLLCAVMLLLFSLIFTVLSCNRLKKRMDYL